MRHRDYARDEPIEVNYVQILARIIARQRRHVRLGAHACCQRCECTAVPEPGAAAPDLQSSADLSVKWRHATGADGNYHHVPARADPAHHTAHHYLLLFRSV